MQRLIRFPILRLFVISFIAGFTISKLLGVEVPLETRGFDPVEGGDSISEDVNLYVASFNDLAFTQNNASDIVIINSVSLLSYDEHDEDNDDDDTYIYISSYRGFNTESGTDQDKGRMLIEVPLDQNSLTASSGVGFIRKSGGWVKKGGGKENAIGNATGTLAYHSLLSEREVEIQVNGSYAGTSYSLGGNSTVQVFSNDVISIKAWSADEDSDQLFNFYATSLSRTDHSYEGFLRRIDDELPEEWQSQFALLRVTDTNDSDGDGVPDLSDLGVEQVLGIIATNSIDLGNGKVWSNDLNTTVSLDPYELWLYGENLGWFYLPDQADSSRIRIYIPDENLGWLSTNAGISPYYIRESDGGQIYFELIEGQVWYYDYNLETWFTPSY